MSVGQRREQRRDQRILFGVAQDAEIRGRGHPSSKIDSGVTVSRVV